jgi:hypothetical protein
MKKITIIIPNEPDERASMLEAAKILKSLVIQFSGEFSETGRKQAANICDAVIGAIDVPKKKP